MHKEFLMGNEAIALGALAAGVNLVSGYPGTPLPASHGNRVRSASLPVLPVSLSHTGESVSGSLPVGPVS